MTLNIIPPAMRARHHETGEWHVLSRGDDALFWLGPEQAYYVDEWEGEGADLHDFDRFKGVVS